MNAEAPVNAGHNFANAAEDYEEREMWLKASEAHSKAADQFEIALKDTEDAEATKTLLLLTSNHERKAKELKRKAERVIKAAANQRMQQMVGINNRNHRLPERPNMNGLVSRMARGEFGESSHHRTGGIGESYALLSNEDHDDDPFNKFLEAVEGLVQQFFNPAVAFTSVPLNENDIPVPVTPTEDKLEEDMSTKSEQTNMFDSYYMVYSPDGSEDDTNNPPVHQIQPMSTGTKQEKSIEQQQKDHYKAENEKLQAQIAQLTKRMKSLEMTAEEGDMLKSSVLQFRNDVHIQARRIMQSHHETSMRSSAAALLGPSGSAVNSSLRHPTLAGGNGHDPASRLRELELENKQLKAQNEKQTVLVNKYRERWEMLKENAKKRRASTPLTEEGNEN
ncbi:uncharacterized protein EV154DRAFT_548807 [Mucor mucedo]|uniref:uncharacterized protein n=1 Tax=Mucor mucedo TaxID=29922 RepID=UPI002220839A|nr:uncharacterized protein EV154DRAFT_548807 [Mucor mucedo]KAI7894652.1 hypothetical protein EV154DRAFT_548807 [Mucor mucedo]